MPAPLTRLATARRRSAYLARFALDTDRFFEPRRADCPWCASPRLHTRPPSRAGLTTDECRDCAHVFQNPRLTPEGQAFYGHHPAPEHPAAARRRHRSAARALLPYGEPESWLDVGTGDAHFPAAAREFFPYTAFDGTDPAPRVLAARAAERVEEAYVGPLATPALTAYLRARYDVVSVLRHLEHTADPRAELRAALSVLRPGGHLLLELTDPAAPPRPGPRPPHLLPAPNLRAELRAQGCEVLTPHRRVPFAPGYRVLARKPAAPTRATRRPVPPPPAPPAHTPARTPRSAAPVHPGTAAPTP
ncbi:class I SAM-dependent methyltransferase [Streptomyces sp. NPDC006997]|uniref:class I SAM-dependent methyltransferase n=1 Tax=Streptomyces sp. NPDC006997 TaxID=3155356 RepID=UPI0033DA7D0A